MSPRYQRKTNKKLFTWEQLTKAKEHIAAGCSIRAAARIVGANEATLRKRLKTGTVPLNLGRFKPTFSREQEEALVERIKIIHDTFHGMSRKQLMAVVYQYAEQNNISHNFNKKKKMVGDHWIRKFSIKYGLTLRWPKMHSGKVLKFKKVEFNKFHDNLKRILAENPKLDASCIYNVDESNISIPVSTYQK
ncbi:uncharacterized protein [Mycetomoellerius zeteki]|uniref:uncharacterized protein n=1 Tax=Mycetomoellerius zeteki TaxID=64791 RepID=UPI00084E3CBC|nr:PREDICTED: uncharacterized protein LOC108725764 [Trachymyrmex zeteki]